MNCDGAADSSWKSLCKMSLTEESSFAVHDNHGVLTTCCICDETYRDPMILPCSHTFCLICLEHVGTCMDKNPGDQMLCPLCKQEFTIPEDGFAALKKNLVMVKLIEITPTEQKASKISLCDKHEQEKLCLYCCDCCEVLCLVCLSECHQKHRLSNLSKDADIVHLQLQSNIRAAEECESDIMKKKKVLLQKKCVFLEKIQGFETEVCQVRRDLKALIDENADSLLQNLDLFRKEQVELTEIEEKELDKQLGYLKSFGIRCVELASNDKRDSMFCKMANHLKEQIVDLKLENKSLVERQLRLIDVSFTKTVPTLSKVFTNQNIIGIVKGNIDYSEKPHLVTTVVSLARTENEGIDIAGMAVFNNDVFIMCDKTPVLSIYNSETHECTAQIDLKGSFREMDPKNGVTVDGNLYFVNSITREILRVDKNRACTRWLVAKDWGHLSVSHESTIVTTCFESHVIKEYSLQGILLQEINLCSTIVHPLHAIKLINGRFVVSHGTFKDAVNRVCLVNDVGSITNSFGSRRGSGRERLDYPICLAVDDIGNVLVLDRNNSRVLVLSPALELRRELLTMTDGLRRPVAMQLVEKTNRLYIADNNWQNFRGCDNKVLVFNVK